jgi:leucyl/phenylalanyl-tRNA--protein transferase
MPIFHLHPRSLAFPSPAEADRSGLLAIGGDLSNERLLAAYSMGIFPWYEDGQPILWWSPDPRLVLFPEKVNVRRSLSKVIKKELFEIRFDSNFEEVIYQCGATRFQDGTWITSQMRRAYTDLHAEGYAHSVEAWSNGELVGGLYGVSLGHCFFGESMFSKQNDASKVALVALCRFAAENGIRFIDCQVTTPHLLSMGAEEMSREDFLQMLHQELSHPTLRGRWMPS